MVMGAAYGRARARYDAAEQAGRGPDVQAAYAAMLVTLVNWCEHQIDAHGTDPGPVEQCPVCARFEEAVPVQAGSARLLMTSQEWEHERRVHQVAHRLGPRIVTLVGCVAAGPPGPAAAQPEAGELRAAP
jgi:hypothetical protein